MTPGTLFARGAPSPVADPSDYAGLDGEFPEPPVRYLSNWYIVELRGVSAQELAAREIVEVAKGVGDNFQRSWVEASRVRKVSFEHDVFDPNLPYRFGQPLFLEPEASMKVCTEVFGGLPL